MLALVLALVLVLLAALHLFDTMYGSDVPGGISVVEGLCGTLVRTRLPPQGQLAFNLVPRATSQAEAHPF